MEIIYAYTREQALADGNLIDVTETAREAGFKIPVAITASVWNDYIVPSSNDGGQSIEGRLWDALFLLFIAIKARRSNGSELLYKVDFWNDEKQKLETKTLKSLIGPGDHMEPVITIMKPCED